MGEDRLPEGGSAASQAVSAKEAYKDIVNNKDNPKYAIYWNANHPDHEKVNKEVLDLIKKSKAQGK
jgi:predicted outer membrane protein